MSVSGPVLFAKTGKGSRTARPSSTGGSNYYLFILLSIFFRLLSNLDCQLRKPFLRLHCRFDGPITHFHFFSDSMLLEMEGVASH
jgi:hypothetical protein